MPHTSSHLWSESRNHLKTGHLSQWTFACVFTTTARLHVDTVIDVFAFAHKYLLSTYYYVPKAVLGKMRGTRRYSVP